VAAAAARPGQGAELRCLLHRAHAGDVHEPQGLSRPDKLCPDDAAIIIDVVSDKRGPRNPGCFEEFIQDLG
jgi:hypothetical protein